MNKEGVHDKETIEDYLKRASDIGVDHVVLRGLWVPENARQDKIYDIGLCLIPVNISQVKSHGPLIRGICHFLYLAAAPKIPSNYGH